MSKLKDLTGKKFGKLTVIKLLYSKKLKDNKHYSHYYLCKCDCGKEVEICLSNLLTGNTKSCGCLKKEYPNHKTHGLIEHRLYKIYNGMKVRCYNKNAINYKDYGGRGITVCQEWLNDFINFYNWAMANGYTDDLSIDRIDNNGNYEPSNCRWANSIEQANNKRNNKVIEYNGIRKTISQWERETGIDHRKISARLNHLKWNAERILITK